MPEQPQKLPTGAEVEGRSRLFLGLAEGICRIGAWVESHPRKALLIAIVLVLVAVGWEANYWPSHNFPGAYWHKTPRGDDIELAQANAAKAGWKELWGYWYGPMIHGHGYYRPITSWLFVFQFRLFGTADGKWAFLNIGLHLAVCVLLIWAGGLLAGGGFARRLTIGTAAALLVGAPGLADRTIQFWICGWWPCQSEMLSLLAGLILLAATVRFVETGRGRWLGLGVASMVLGILCKEMTYVAALGACLLLVRHRKRWWGGFALVIPALVLFAFRKWAIRNVEAEGGIPMGSLAAHVLFELSQWADQTAAAWMHFAVLAVAVGVAWVVMRRSGALEKVIVAGIGYFSGVALLMGMPWEVQAAMGTAVIVRTAISIAIVIGLARASRRWPVPELLVIWLLTLLPAMGFMPIFAWYRYWSDVFGSLLLVIAVWELIQWRVAPLIRLSPCPSQNTPQTPGSLSPEAGESLASGPSAA